ncbi:MAG: hypothetical protein DME40_00890 [Verrucomicrobia bacterium]|nr:MAG: hypothetical protein DME40_00890 [Verrucomicrobiota bacterium]
MATKADSLVFANFLKSPRRCVKLTPIIAVIRASRARSRENFSKPKKCLLRCSIAPVCSTTILAVGPTASCPLISITVTGQDARSPQKLEPCATIRCLSSTMRNLHFNRAVSSSRTLGMKRLFVCALLLCAGADLFSQQNTPPLQQQETPPVLPQQNTPPLPPPEEGAPPPMKPSTTPPPVAPIVVAAPKQPNGKIQKSLVRITSTEVEPDYRAPWNTGAIGRGVGAGFVIDGPRIMTNAHVVSNARYLTVEREGDPNKYPARVVFVAHDCDLALITVDSPEFFKNMVPLGFGGIPELESTVSAYGYPIGRSCKMAR